MSRLLNGKLISCRVFPFFRAMSASFELNINFSGERLYVMIRLGYRDAKSRPVTSLFVSIPFLGGKTYTPGYFLFYIFTYPRAKNNISFNGISAQKVSYLHSICAIV